MPGVVGELVRVPGMVVPGTREEHGLCVKPPHQAGQRPSHHGPAKPLETFPEIVRGRHRVVEEALGEEVGWVLARLAQEDNLSVRYPIDAEPGHEQDNPNDESRIIVVTLAVVY